MRQQLGLTWLIARRELTDQMRDWRVIMPMVILILFFPYLMNFAAQRSVDFIAEYGGGLIGDRIIPFLLMVVGFFPITVSLVVALEAFVGEKERGTIEPMLSSPLADWHMYMGKLIAGSLVPLAASYVSIALYLVGLYIQKIPFPPPDVMIQMLLLTAVQAVLMVSAAIVISTQSTSVRAANLLASFIVLPVSMLVTGESILIFWGDNEVLWTAIVGVLVTSALLIRLGLAHFQREALIGREIDMLNLRWALSELWKRWSGSNQAPATLRYLGERILAMRRKPVDSPLRFGQALLSDLSAIPNWYRVEVPRALKVISRSIQIVTVLGLLASLSAFFYTRSQLSGLKLTPEMQERAVAGIKNMVIEGNSNVINISGGQIFANNTRTEAIIFGLGLFSFSVAGVFIYLINFALIGGVLGVTELAGLSPLGVFLFGILPHGIVELPSVIITTAAVLHLGVRLVTPNRHITISEVLLDSLAVWLKIFIGVGVPLLLVAAILETTVTPLLLQAFLSQVFLPGAK